MTPDGFVQLAVERGAKIVTSTYNEPLITSEWAVEIFRKAKEAGLVTSFVSNGNGTPEVIEYLQPWVDLYKVDLKGFRQKEYAQLGGVLNNVLDTIQLLHQKKFWLEVVTLLIPGFNDSDEEVNEMAEFLASVSPEIPWHVTAFHKDYRMTDPDDTPSSTLMKAAEAGYAAGLHYVYAGNRPGSTGRFENTYCPSCSELLIERWGFLVKQNRVRNGHCFKCGTPIAGRWQIDQAGGKA
jgi:pyruvate formate lyase activating enzyme